jgi:hypothetical protein
MKVNVVNRINTDVKVLGTQVEVVFTGEEFHDLQVIAHISDRAMHTALATDGYGSDGHGIRTFDVYGLLHRLKEIV